MAKSRVRGVVVSIVLAIGGVMAGCQSVPDGNSGGRISAYQSTQTEDRSSGQSLSELTEFSDYVAQQLVLAIPDDSTVQALTVKGVLALGDIENGSHNTSSGDYVMFQRRIRSQLVNSKALRKLFMVVDDPARVQKLINKMNSPGPRDLLQEGNGGGPAAAEYDPKITFLITGDFHEAARGNKHQWFSTMKVVNLGSGAIVIEKSADSARLVAK